MRKDRLLHGNNFRLCEDGCTVMVSNAAVPLKSSLIQACTPLSLEHRFYEVELLEDVSPDGNIYYMMGTNTAIKGDNCCWNMRLSLRYRSLEGGIFTAGDGLRSDALYGKKGDIITVYLEASFADKQLINFFLNGRLVYRQWIHVSAADLCPAIGVSVGPARFKVTWPGKTTKPRVDFDKIHCLSNWIGFRNISRDNTTGTLELMDGDRQTRPGFNIQSPRPLNEGTFSFFEIELLTCENPEMCPAVGQTPAWCSKFQYPGWKPRTIGYHADDGHIHYESSSTSKSNTTKSAKCGPGDRMGCGLVYQPNESAREHEEQAVLVYFTKNGTIVHVKPMMMPPGGFYPTIALYAVGDKVKVYSPSTPPMIPPEVLQVFHDWYPVYRDFRFSETITFPDYLGKKSRNKICFNSQTDSAAVLQYIKHKEDGYTCEIEVESIDSHCKFEMGMATTEIRTQKEVLGLPSRPALCVGKGTDLPCSKGDRFMLTVRRMAPTVTWVTVKFNDRTVFRTEVFHCSKREGFPTLCCLGGHVTLNVVWPDEIQSKDDYSDTTNLSSWVTDSRVTLTMDDVTCPAKVEEHMMYNIVAPFPVSEKAPFYFEISRGPTTDTTPVALPGIGVTNGMCPVRCWDVIPWRDIATVIFYGSKGQFTTWKGTYGCKQTERNVTTAGCAIIYNDSKYQLQFFINGQFVIGHTFTASIGGVYPVISFLPESAGSRVQVDITAVPDTSGQVTSQDVSTYDAGLLEWGDTDMKEVIDVVRTVDSGLSFDSKKQEKLSSLTSLYIIFSPHDVPHIQGMIQRFWLKGYTVHVSAVTDDADVRASNMEMSEVVLCCLSVAAVAEPVVEEDLGLALSKNIPVLPIIVKQVAWPPAGRLSRYATSMQRYADAKLDFSSVEIGDMETFEIELNLQTAVGVSKQPVVLGPNPSYPGPGIGKDRKTDKHHTAMKNVPSKAVYAENGSESKTCTIL